MRQERDRFLKSAVLFASISGVMRLIRMMEGNARLIIRGLQILCEYTPDECARIEDGCVVFEEDCVPLSDEDRNTLLSLGWALDHETQRWYYEV